MDTLPSSEFRKTFGRLTKPTRVTVNGHFIGVWTPWETAEAVNNQERLAWKDELVRSRPFTPAPKPGKGK